MSRPDRPIKILVYEDNNGYYESLKLMARKERIITDHVTNVDDLLERVKENPKKYQFLVLDARAYMHEDEQEGQEDEMNLITIMQELAKLKYEQGIIVPYCINTGFADLKLRMGAKVDCTIFEKGKEKELFDFIWETFANTELSKLLHLHPAIFDVVHDYFDDADYEVIADMFTHEKYKRAQISDRIDNLNKLRRISEHLMDLVHARYLGGDPTIVTAIGSRLGQITKHINDTEGIPVHVFGTLTAIRKTAGAYGSHTPDQATALAEYPSGDYIAGLAMSLKDVFTWAKTKLN
jgi:hypothetical protein